MPEEARSNDPSPATPVLSWSLFVSLLSFAISIVFLFVWVFTCTHHETPFNSFHIVSRGERIYAHPLITLAWILAGLLCGASGVVNLFAYVYYSKKAPVARIVIPFIGSVTLPKGKHPR